MGIFEHFPYTNFHELNLDWIIQTIKEMDESVRNFISINSIKYANPIQWDITSQYEKNTVVLDKHGNAYLSVQTVPAGISLDRTEYWTVIGNFSELWENVKAAVTPNDEGHNKTASADRAVGDWVWVNDTLYLITKEMTAGDKYIDGSNCQNTNIMTLYNNLSKRLDTSTLNLQGQITNEATARENSDNILQENINNEATARENADSKLEKTLTDLVNSSGIRSIVCIGDSYAGVYPGNRWLALLKNILNIPDDKFFWKADSGGGFAAGAGSGDSFLERLTAVADTMTEEQKNSITQVIVCGGANDAVYISSGTVDAAIKTFCSYANATFKNAEICIGFIGNAYNGEKVRNYQTTMQLYRKCAGFGKRTRYLNGVEWVMYNKNYMLSDLLHPNDDGSMALATEIANCLYSGSCSVMYEYGDVTLDIGTIYGSFSDGQVMFKAKELTLNQLPQDFRLNYTEYEIASGIFPFCYGDVFGKGTKIPCKLLLSGTTPSLKAYVPGFLIYKAGKWYITGFYINPETGNWDTYTGGNLKIYTEDFSTTVIE